jgi:hypothetical protein
LLLSAARPDARACGQMTDSYSLISSNCMVKGTVTSAVGDTSDALRLRLSLRLVLVAAGHRAVASSLQGRTLPLSSLTGSRSWDNRVGVYNELIAYNTLIR